MHNASTASNASPIRPGLCIVRCASPKIQEGPSMRVSSAKCVTFLASLTLVVLTLVLLPASSAQSAKVLGPDLIVRGDVLSRQWVVRDENLAAGACSVEEGGVSPGLHRLIRFTVMTPNVGDTDINLGDPNVHVAAGDGLYEF